MIYVEKIHSACYAKYRRDKGGFNKPFILIDLFIGGHTCSDGCMYIAMIRLNFLPPLLIYVYSC